MGQELTSEPRAGTQAGQLILIPETQTPDLRSYIISQTCHSLSIQRFSPENISPSRVVFTFMVQGALESTGFHIKM